MCLLEVLGGWHEIIETWADPGAHKTQQRMVPFFPRTWLDNDVAKRTAQWQGLCERQEDCIWH